MKLSFIHHHILNRMNSLGMVLSFSADNYFIRICRWWDKRKTTGDFLLFRSLWCCLNLGCEIKDILLIDNSCQIIIVGIIENIGLYLDFISLSQEKRRAEKYGRK